MPFKPGQSGNPAGRPKGSKHKTTLIVEALLEEGARDVVQAVLQAARDGDISACRVVLERILPPIKERPIELMLPDTSTAKGISLASQCVLDAVADGGLTPNEGKVLSDLVEARRKALETQELESRIAALEAKQ